MKDTRAWRGPTDPQREPEVCSSTVGCGEPFAMPELDISGWTSMAPPCTATWCTHGFIVAFGQQAFRRRIQRLSTGIVVLWFQRRRSVDRLIVAGPWTIAPDIPHDGVDQSAAVMLRPGAARAVFGLPVSEIAARRYDLETLLPLEGGRLLRRLTDLGNLGDILACMHDWMAGRIAAQATARDAELVTGIRSWLQCGDRPPRLEDIIGGTQRSVQRWFAEGVGMPPRDLDALWRIGRSLRRSLRLADPDWRALALTGGFSDQAHLCRTWKAILGTSPAAFHKHWRTNGGAWLDGMLIHPERPAPE